MPVCNAGSHLLARAASRRYCVPARTRSPVRRPPPLTSPGRMNRATTNSTTMEPRGCPCVMLPARLLVGSNVPREDVRARRERACGAVSADPALQAPAQTGKSSATSGSSRNASTPARLPEGERREAISVWVHHYNYCESWAVNWNRLAGWRRAASGRRKAVALTTIRLIGCVSMDTSGSGVWGVGARPAHLDGLIRRPSVLVLSAEVDHHSIALK